MKKILVTAFILATITGCSFVKDVQSHCRPNIVYGDIQTGSFNACLECDSLAKVVWSHIKKQTEKR